MLLLAFLSIILSMLAAFYLQLPSFVLALGYGWSYRYPTKRWLLRIAAIIAFGLFLNAGPALWAMLLVGLPFAFFWIFSLFNANSNLFIALSPHHIIKQKQAIYPGNTEVVGYADDDGNAICYPVYEMVMPHHLLNDVFCNKPVFVSYCAACRSTMIYNPMVNGQQLSFEVLGVYRRNMIIRDLQTGTVWQQGTGKAMYGPLKGTQLEFYAYQQTTLVDWLQQYPDSYIARESDKVRKGLVPRHRLMKMLTITEKFIGPGKVDFAGLPPREPVWGLEINGQSKAYPVSELRKVAELSDHLGGLDIEIHYNPASNQISGVVTQSQAPLKLQYHWWFGWKEFHPDTDIWRKE